VKELALPGDEPRNCWANPIAAALSGLQMLWIDSSEKAMDAKAGSACRMHVSATVDVGIACGLKVDLAAWSEAMPPGRYS